MADYDSDDSVHEVLMISSDSEQDVSEISDLEEAPEIEVDTPPQSPYIGVPYVNPDNPHLPYIINGWKNEMNWPQMELPPFNPNKYPLTNEPPKHTVPVMVGRIHDLEEKFETLVEEVESLATQGSVTMNREYIRELRTKFNDFSHMFNHNSTILQAVQGVQENMVIELNYNTEIENYNTETMTNAIVNLERKVLDLETRLHSNGKRHKASKSL
jgi:hypothetical protein